MNTTKKHSFVIFNMHFRVILTCERGILFCDIPNENSFAHFPVVLRFGSVNIGVRAGGARGAAAPPKFWASQIFWAARENLGKASF